MKTTLKEVKMNTTVRNKSDGVRRQPNERDESPDGGEIEPRPDMKQAYDDLQNGMVDTDLRGTPGVDQAVNPEVKRQATPTKTPHEGSA